MRPFTEAQWVETKALEILLIDLHHYLDSIKWEVDL